MSRLSLYYHTLRHLKGGQIAARIRLRTLKPRIDASPPPRTRPGALPFVPPIPSARSLLAPDVFRFLGVERRCSSPADWMRTDVSKLWRYNLHYFDYLDGSDLASRADWHVSLLDRWVREVEPGTGDGWEPYPLSRRAVNWIKWSLAGGQLPAQCLASLAMQMRWLEARLEYHLLGNHLLANAKALVYAGLYFEGDEAERWYRTGLGILEAERGEQLLADGAHFELSPMYHATVLEDVLDVVNLMHAHGRTDLEGWRVRIPDMLRWLACMSHPDGGISFFNDAAFGIAPDVSRLRDYANRLGCAVGPAGTEGLVVMRASGYVRATVGPACLLCDCAAVGPDYLPGHAHADTLSFELSLEGHRVFVNSGTSVYGTGPERDRQRGTLAHNTVAIDGQDSSEVWAGFRVARRARATLKTAASGPPLRISASHDGYRRLPGRNEHQREWCLSDGGLTIEDRIAGPFGAAQAALHLHPDAAVRPGHPDGSVVEVGVGGRTVVVQFENADAVSCEESTWHPEFGLSIANRRIVARFRGPLLRTVMRWAGSP